jgi:hypothetical protein
MSDGLVRARMRAVVEVNHGLSAYGRAVDQACGSARSDLTATAAQFQAAVADRQRLLAQATQRREMIAAALRQCRENCEPIAQDLARAQVIEQDAQGAFARSKQAQARFERIANELRSSLQTFEQSVTQLVPAGRSFVGDYAESLEAYLRRQVAE